MYSNAKLLETFNAGNNIKLHEMLTENVREETIKQAGKSASEKQILKKLFCKDCNARFKNYAIPYGENRFAFLDGYRLFTCDNSFGYENIPEKATININQIMEPAQRDCTLEIPIDKSKIKEFAAIRKDKYTPYSINITGVGLLAFNPVYMVHLLEWTGSDSVLINPNGARDNVYVQPIINATTANGNGALLLPVHLRANDEQPNETIDILSI